MVDLSTEEDRREYWRAVSFRVADKYLLLDEQKVAELLTVPQITVIPGTKHWVAGVANVRGELLPIVNFGDFLFEQPVVPSKQARVLVISHDEVRSGLIVDEVSGMRRFPVDTRLPPHTEGMPDSLGKLVEGCFEEEQVFHILDVTRLINESEFMQAAA